MRQLRRVHEPCKADEVTRHRLSALGAAVAGSMATALTLQSVQTLYCALRGRILHLSRSSWVAFGQP